MFGIMAAAAAGGVAGYFAGTTIGQTRPATPLHTTIRLTRDQLAATATQLEKASEKLNASQRGDLAGSALVVGRRITELTNSLGRLDHKAKKEGPQ
ncbi:MAG: hypothetical protein ACYDCK_00835 [Thermoplasmatota archaeon]